ncbi:MAG: Mur ligase family protein, partial [Planctomycetota bacterium]
MDQLRMIQQSFRCLKIRDWSSDWTDIFTSDTQVVHSIAVPVGATIFEQARRAHCGILSLPEALGQIARSRQQVCIAGTHGKTTTSGLVSWILRHSNREAFHFVGGEFCQPSALSPLQSTPSAQADWAVLESCEYRNSFLSLHPNVVIITGIEPDHFDFFESSDDLSRSFASFMNRCHFAGTIIVNADCPTSLALASQSGRSIVTYSVTSCTMDWCAKPAATTWPTESCSRSGQ